MCLGGLSGWRWATAVGLCLHVQAIAARHRKSLPGREGYLIGAQSLFDQVRITVATFIWKTGIVPFMYFCKLLLPPELAFYACEVPIFDLSDIADYGVAMNIKADGKKQPPAKVSTTAPPVNGSANDEPHSTQPQPQYFVCNVGHIETDHPAGLNDLQKTMNTTREVWHELPSYPGFVSNTVCLFPALQGTTFAKEVNLSAWETPKAAYDWYVGSPGHKRVMSQ